MAIATPTEYGGYEYKFVNPVPDRCICNICHLPSRDAYMTGQCCEGQTICKSCLDQWQKTAGNMKCPVCREETGGFSQNYHMKREIKSLYIYCANKEKGCKWQGELNDINNHLGNSDSCRFEEVKCSNECGKMIQRRYLTSHVETECPRRKVNCQYCHDTGEHQFIEGQHKEECPKLPLPCPNKCEVGSVPREDMEAHRKKCPLEMIQCEYHSVGCEVRMARKDQEEHDNENVKEHLMMTKQGLSKLDNELTNTKAQLGIAFNQITNLTEMMKLSNSPTNVAGHIAVAKWSITLDVMATMLQSGYQSCPITIKMSECNGKKKDKVEWYSEPFYTNNKGHKMGLRVDTAGFGDGKGTHLSMFLFLLKGPHDNELTWPLRGMFEIKLLNQISDSEHHSMTLPYDDNTPHNYTTRVTDGNRSEDAWGYHRYISNEDLNKITPICQYLKDDCLFFQVTKL